MTALIASGAESVFRDAGLMLIVMNSEHDPLIEASHLRYLHARRADAILSTSASDYHPAVAAALKESEVPVVLIEADMPTDVGTSIVVSDHRAGIRDAMTRLIGLAHRRIVCCRGPALSGGARAMAGADEAAGIAGNVRVDSVECGLERRCGPCRRGPACSASSPPSARFASSSSDQMLEGVSSGHCTEQGLKKTRRGSRW